MSSASVPLINHTPPPQNAHLVDAYNTLIKGCWKRRFGLEFTQKEEGEQILQSDLSLLRIEIQKAANELFYDPNKIDLDTPFLLEGVELNEGKGFLIMPGQYTSTGKDVYRQDATETDKDENIPVLWEHFIDLEKILNSLTHRKHYFNLLMTLDRDFLHLEADFLQGTLVTEESQPAEYDETNGIRTESWDIEYKVMELESETDEPQKLYYTKLDESGITTSWIEVDCSEGLEIAVQKIIDENIETANWEAKYLIQPVCAIDDGITLLQPELLEDEDKNGVAKAGCDSCCNFSGNPISLLASILPELSTKVNTPLALSMPDCNGLQIAHFIAIYSYAGHLRGQYNCDTFIEHKYYGDSFDINGNKALWRFWYVRRPSGALVPFIWNFTTNVGEASSEYKKHEYKLKDLGFYQEIQFNDGVSHIMNTSELLRCEVTDINAKAENNIPGPGVGITSLGSLYKFVNPNFSTTLLEVDDYAYPVNIRYGVLSNAPFSVSAGGTQSLTANVRTGTTSAMSPAAISSAMPEYDQIARITFSSDANDAAGFYYSAFFPDGGTPSESGLEQCEIMDYYNTLEQPIAKYVEKRFANGTVFKGYWHRYGTELRPMHLTVFERSINENENILEIRTVIRFDGNSVRSESRHYSIKRSFGFGEETIREYRAYGTDEQREAVYEYDNNQASGSYGKLLFHRDFNGAWARYEYDVMGRLTKETTPFADSPEDAPEDRCKVVIYDYAPLHAAETAEPTDSRPRTVLTYNLGIESDRQYHLYFEQESWDITTTAPNATWDDESNLVTKHYRYTEGDFMGRHWQTVNPDGSRTETSYIKHNIENPGTDDETYDLETVTESGFLPNSGTREVTMQNAVGHLLSRRTYDITTGKLTDGNDYTYDDFGRVIGETTVDADTTATVYNCCGPRFVTAPDNSVTEYGYDVFNRQVLTAASGLTTVQKYDADDNVIESTLIGKEDGELITRYEYNDDGELLREINPSGAVTTYKYGDNWSETTNALGYVQVSEYYLDGRLKSTNGNAVYPRTYKYGVENGELYTLECAAGEPQSRTYTDHRGRQYKTVYPDGFTELTIYDKFSRVIRQENSKGAKTLYLYDEATGKLKYQVIKVLDSSNEIDWENDIILEYEQGYAEKYSTMVSYRKTYKYSNNVKELIFSEEISRDGKKLWVTQDGKTTYTEKIITGIATAETTIVKSDGTSLINKIVDGNLVQSTDSVLGMTEYTYDEFNRQIGQAHEANGVVTSIRSTLNKLGKPVEVTQLAGTDSRSSFYTYDCLGRRTSETTFEGIITSFSYTMRGELSRVFDDNHCQECFYNAKGQIIKLVTYQNENTPQVITFDYDNCGRLIRKIYPDNIVFTYNYSDDKLASVTNGRNQTHSYSYDLTGQVIKIDSTADIEREYEYDQQNRLVKVKDDFGEFSLEYDSFGNIISETFPQGITVFRSYDDQQRLSEIKLDDNILAAYNYADNGLLAGIDNGTATVNYSYIPGTKLIQRKYWQIDENMPFLNLEYSYDNYSRLSSIVTNNQFLIGYTLNDDNQRMSASLYNGVQWEYTYDSLNQIIGAAHSNNDQPDDMMSYNYDMMGNRISAIENGEEKLYQSNLLNQYTMIDNEESAYDNDGNMLNNRGWAYTWNTENRLIRAVKDDLRLEFSYDYMGRRLKKMVYQSEQLVKYEYFIYFGYKLIAVYDALNDNSLQKTFIWQPIGIDTPLCMTVNGDSYYYISDGNKNILGMVDNTGNFVANYSYGPFGEILTETDIIPEFNPFRFSSEYFDQETELIYFNYRYYDAQIGRWIKRDPIMEAGGSNVYTAVGNNMINNIDWLGLAGCCGPDVTDWFIKDIEEHVKYFTDRDRGITFWNQAKYLMGHKWMNFNMPGCAILKDCFNTVMLANRCIMKNQLGNIMYGLIARYHDSAFRNIVNIFGGAIYRGYSLGPKYSNGKERTDNIVAFAYGYALASIMQGLNISRIDLVKTLSDPSFANMYADIYKKVHSKDVLLSIDDLSLSEKGSVKNCSPCGKKYPVSHVGSIRYMKTLLWAYTQKYGVKIPILTEAERDEWILQFQNYNVRGPNVKGNGDFAPNDWPKF